MPQQLFPTMLTLCNFASGVPVLRLARFNAMQSDLPTFIGLPVPGAAIGLLLSVSVLSSLLVALSTCLLAWLMISQVKFPHFKKIKVDEEEVHGIH